MVTQAAFCVLFLLLTIGTGLGQVPQLYLYGGLSLNGTGLSPVSGTAGAGLDLETNHMLAVAETWTNSAHKQDSGTGYEIGTQAQLFSRTARNWYFGAGARWSEVTTSIYSKQGWHPTFGGGKDFMRESFSARAQLMYVLPGTDHLNALQGPELSLRLPSPASPAHLFYREAIGIYEFNQASVPGDSGIHTRSFTSSVQFTVLYRY
jgi:hypothetical protein